GLAVRYGRHFPQRYGVCTTWTGRDRSRPTFGGRHLSMGQLAMAEIQPQALVVEDNPLAREGLAELLRRRGFDVTTAENGQKALLELRKQSPPAVIILDMLMPVFDGWHFLAEFKNL